MSNNESVCSSGDSVNYYWRFCSTSNHIGETVINATEKLRKNGYTISGVLQGDFEAQIEYLLELAEMGALKPIDHIKRIHRAKPLNLYEIRWDNLKVFRTEKASGLYSQAKVRLRLYMVEEGDNWVVGLYLHEKRVIKDNSGETNRLQDVEIDAAVKLCEDCSDENWRVKELETHRLREQRHPRGIR